jgi:hypothetical protein
VTRHNSARANILAARSATAASTGREPGPFSLNGPQCLRRPTSLICADMPNANWLTLGIMAMVAEEERRMISERTKAALAAAKARGVVIGGDRETVASRRARKLAGESVERWT